MGLYSRPLGPCGLSPLRERGWNYNKSVQARLRWHRICWAFQGCFLMIIRSIYTLAELALFIGLVLATFSGCAKKMEQEQVSQAASSEQPEQTEPTEQQAMSATSIPREVLFGNPSMAQSPAKPRCKWLSFLKPVDGVLNVWVGPSDDVASAEPVTEDKIRGIRMHGWAYNSKYILYTQDKAATRTSMSTQPMCKPKKQKTSLRSQAYGDESLVQASSIPTKFS